MEAHQPDVGTYRGRTERVILFTLCNHRKTEAVWACTRGKRCKGLTVGDVRMRANKAHW